MGAMHFFRPAQFPRIRTESPAAATLVKGAVLETMQARNEVLKYRAQQRARRESQQK